MKVWLVCHGVSHIRLTQPTDSKPHKYLTPSPESSRPRTKTRRAQLRALTTPGVVHDAMTFHLPSRSEVSPSTRRRAFIRRDSSGSSSHSSSPSIREMPETVAASTSAMGRKVADSLQLFKESTSSPVVEYPRTTEHTQQLSSPSKRRKEHVPEDVTAAEFEFVKRADWSEREAAAIRRDKSTPALEKVLTRDSGSTHASSPTREDRDEEEPRPARPRRRTSPILQENVMYDLRQWRQDIVSHQEVAEAHRGRSRMRPASKRNSPAFHVGSSGSDSVHSSHSTILDPQEDRPWSTEPSDPPPASQSRSSLYPPSPSPSRPPVARVPSASSEDLPPTIFHHHAHKRSSSPLVQKLSKPIPSHILTSSPHAHTDPLPSPALSHLPYSPWSSEDESGWDTVSNTSIASQRSTWSVNSPETVDDPLAPVIYGQESHDLHGAYDGLFNGVEGSAERPDEDVLLPESLPHIPLEPFRNQVGGHSAIYKFTKRAVCKVRIIFLCFLMFLTFSNID